jgi:hypothetical protein
LDHSFETRPGGRPGLMTGLRVRWVDPGQPKKKNTFNFQDDSI